MDPVTAILGVVDVAISMCERAEALRRQLEDMKDREPCGKQLAARVARLKDELVALKVDLAASRISKERLTSLEQDMHELEDCTSDALHFIEKAAKQGVFKRFIRADRHLDTFEKLNTRLTSCVVDLGFGCDREDVARQQEQAVEQSRKLDELDKRVEQSMKQQQEQHTGVVKKIDGVGQQVSQLSEMLSPRPVQPIDENAYAEAIQKAFGRLLGVADALESGSQFRELGLQDIFEPQDVRLLSPDFRTEFDLPADYVALLQDTSQVERLDEAVKRRMIMTAEAMAWSQTRQSVMKLLSGSESSTRWSVVLGAPGAGKTSALRAHALAWATASPADRAKQPVPVLVELKQYANVRGSCSALLDCMAEGGAAPASLDKAALLSRLSSERSVLLMLDGLDEIFDVQLRAAVLHDVKLFAQRFPAARVALTSRIIGYRLADLEPYSFVHWTLQPLTNRQITAFVQRWQAATYTQAEATQRDQRQQRLLAALREVDSIRLLATNPLLLTMIAIVNRSPELPTQRVALYDKCSELLLDRWKTSEAIEAVRELVGELAGRSIVLFTRLHKEMMLMELAERMQDDDKPLGNLVQEPLLQLVVLDHVMRRRLHAEPELLMAALLRQLRERHYILCYLGAASYAFVHRTFLEYFCAKRIQKRFQDQEIDESWLQQLFHRRARDATWREVLVLVSGMLTPVALYRCLDVLLEAHETELDALALTSLAQFVQRDGTQAAEQQLRSRFEEMFMYKLPPALPSSDTANLHLLVQLWPDKKMRAFLETLATSHVWNGAGAAVAALSFTWRDERCRAVVTKVATSGLQSSRAAVRALASYWRDDGTRSLLETLAVSDKPGADSALTVLKEHWKDDRTRSLSAEIAASNQRGLSGSQSSLRRWEPGPTN